MFRKRLAGRQYGFIRALWLCYSSTDFYHDVFHNWKWKTFTYFVFINLLTVFPQAYTSGVFAQTFLTNEQTAALLELPDISIQNGKFSINKTSPYYVINDNNGKILVTVDTAIKANDSMKMHDSIFITSDSIVFPERTLLVSDLADGNYTARSFVKRNMHLSPNERLYELYWILYANFMLACPIILACVMLTWLVSKLRGMPFSVCEVLQFSFLAFTPAAFFRIFLPLHSYELTLILSLQFLMTLVVLYWNLAMIHKWHILNNFFSEESYVL